MPQYDAGDIVYSIDGDLSPLSRALNDATKQAHGMAQNFANVGAKVGQGFTVMGGAITAGLGVAVKGASDFGAAMAKVNSLAINDLGAMTDAVKEVSAEFGIALPDAAEAAYQALSAGASEAQTPLLLAEAAKAAVAGVSDLTTAIELGTGVTNAFGLEISNISTLYDQAFVAVKLGVTTFDELAGSVGRVAPTFAGLKLGSDEMFASVTALTTANIQTSEAVTGLKAALSNVIQPSSVARDMAEQLGIQFDAAALSSMGLAGFLDMVAQATGGNIEAMGKLFGSSEAVNVVMALTGQQAGIFNKALDEMKTKTGQTQEAFDLLVAADPSRAFTLLWNQVQILGVEIGTSLMPALKAMLDLVTPIVKSVLDWVRVNPELTTGIVTVTGAVGAFMLATGPILMLLPGIVAGAGALGGALAALTGPVGIAAAAIGVGLVVAFQYAEEIVAWFRANWEHFALAFRESWETIKAVLDVFGEVLMVVFDQAGFALRGFVEGATGQYSLGNVAESFRMGADSIQETLHNVADAIEAYRLWWNDKLGWIVEYTAWAASAVIDSLAPMLKWLELAGAMGDWWNGGASSPPPEQGEGAEGFYKGGRVRRGQLVTVGELGPELFVPSDFRNAMPGIVGERGPETGKMPASGFIYTAAQTAVLGRVGLRNKPLGEYDERYQQAVLKALNIVERIYNVSAANFLRASRVFHPRMLDEYRNAGLSTGGVIQMTEASMRAGGGPVRAGGAYIVGERAPEVFVPRQDGTVLNPQQLAGLGGNNTVNATINVHATPGMDIERLADEIDRRLYRLAQNHNRRMGSPALATG